MRRGGVLVLAALLAPVGSAHAAGVITRTSPNATIDYAAVGPANVVLTDAPQGTGTVLTIAEPGISLSATAVDCTDLGDAVTCAFTFPNEGRINLTGSTGADTFDGSALTRSVMSVQSDAGPDTLRGGQLEVDPDGFAVGDSLNPGAGVDQIFGGAGNDFLTALSEGGELGDGGPGDDSFIALSGGATPDILRGGPGRDEVWVRHVGGIKSFTVDLAAGTSADRDGVDATDVIEGFENARTDDGDDVLLGTDGYNVLRSGAGQDRIDGRLGADELFGEAGGDQLEARDGIADRLSAGDGMDTCLTDQLDETSSCESIQLLTLPPIGPPPPPEVVPPDVDPPDCRTRGLAGRPRARVLARRGLSLLADCDEPGRVTVRLVAPLRRLGGRARLARAGDLELARRTVRLGIGNDARVRLRVSVRLRGLIRSRIRLRVEVRAVDSAGNRAAPIVRRLRPR